MIKTSNNIKHTNNNKKNTYKKRILTKQPNILNKIFSNRVCIAQAGLFFRRLRTLQTFFKLGFYCCWNFSSFSLWLYFFFSFHVTSDVQKIEIFSRMFRFCIFWNNKKKEKINLKNFWFP